MLRRILLVDDELHIRRAAEFKLKTEFEVVSAEDGQEAWEMIEQVRPDVLVTDLQMPRMSGFELVKRVRSSETTADLPVILLTAKGFELVHDEAFGSLKIFRVVFKPFSPRELCKLVHSALQDDKSREVVGASRKQELP